MLGLLLPGAWLQPARPDRRPILATALMVACLACVPFLAGRPTWAEEVTGPPAVSAEFANPPLLYQGPDPTAEIFLPSLTQLATSERDPADPRLLGPSLAAVPYAAAPSEGELFVGPTGEPLAGIRDHKDGFFQKLSFSAAWIRRNDNLDDFGETELDLFGTVAVPAPWREWPLLITPAFNLRLLDGPGTVDLPPRLYETYLDFTWLPRLSARWTAILGVAPGVYSDFETSEDAFRLTGKLLARYDWRIDQLQLVFGVLYLDRYDITWLPAGGIIWTPAPGRKYELVFPRPKLAHRIRYSATFEDWVYLGGEIGGNSYATESVGAITLRGYRAYLGLERRFDGGAGLRFEIGYAIGREIEFETGMPSIQADDSVMVRGGVTF